MASGILYIVATPIGNRGDLSARAEEVLAGVDLIAAEDTRHSSKLLQHLGIKTRVQAYHDFSSKQVGARLLQLLHEGKHLALISDAGTPLIADPGLRLVQAARQAGHQVLPIPGPSALLAALAVAGLPTDRFVFEGFPPATATARQQHFAALKDEPRTLIFYEAPHRLLSCLSDLRQTFGPDRQAFIGRELTKQFETHYRGSLGELAQQLQANPAQHRGEFVLILAGADPTEAAAAAHRHAMQVATILHTELGPQLPLKQLATLTARLTNTRKNGHLPGPAGAPAGVTATVTPA